MSDSFGPTPRDDEQRQPLTVTTQELRAAQPMGPRPTSDNNFYLERPEQSDSAFSLTSELGPIWELGAEPKMLQSPKFQQRLASQRMYLNPESETTLKSAAYLADLFNLESLDEAYVYAQSMSRAEANYGGSQGLYRTLQNMWHDGQINYRINMMGYNMMDAIVQGRRYDIDQTLKRIEDLRGQLSGQDLQQEHFLTSLMGKAWQMVPLQVEGARRAAPYAAGAMLATATAGAALTAQATGTAAAAGTVLGPAGAAGAGTVTAVLGSLATGAGAVTSGLIALRVGSGVTMTQNMIGGMIISNIEKGYDPRLSLALAIPLGTVSGMVETAQWEKIRNLIPGKANGLSKILQNSINNLMAPGSTLDTWLKTGARIAGSYVHELGEEMAQAGIDIVQEAILSDAQRFLTDTAIAGPDAQEVLNTLSETFTESAQALLPMVLVPGLAGGVVQQVRSNAQVDPAVHPLETEGLEDETQEPSGETPAGESSTLSEEELNTETVRETENGLEVRLPGEEPVELRDERVPLSEASPQRRTAEISGVETLEGFKEKVAEAFPNVTPEQVDQVGEVVTAHARTTGETPDQYIQRRIAPHVELGVDDQRTMYQRLLDDPKVSNKQVIEKYIRDSYGPQDAQHYIDEAMKYYARVTKGHQKWAIGLNRKTIMSLDLTTKKGAALLEAGEITEAEARRNYLRTIPGEKGLIENLQYESEQITEMPEPMVKFFNSLGGLRVNSFGDYVQERDHDIYAQIIKDAQSKGLTLKIITKMKETIDDWVDQPGVQFNYSTDYQHSTWFKELVQNLSPEDTKRVHQLISPAPTIEEATEVAAEHDNVVTRYVAINAQDMAEAATDDRIGVVTSYHGQVEDTLFEFIKRKRPDLFDTIGGPKLEEFVNQFDNIDPADVQKGIESRRRQGKLKDQADDAIAHTQEQVSRDEPLNPRVSNVVDELNANGIYTTLSGDLYGEELAYVDLRPDQAAAVREADLPDGWRLVPNTTDPTLNVRQPPDLSKSVVVDEGGEPLRLFRGLTTAYRSGIGDRQAFTDTPGIASVYSENYGAREGRSTVTPVYLDIRTPLRIGDEDGFIDKPDLFPILEELGYSEQESDELLSRLREQDGYPEDDDSEGFRVFHLLNDPGFWERLDGSQYDGVIARSFFGTELSAEEQAVGSYSDSSMSALEYWPAREDQIISATTGQPIRSAETAPLGRVRRLAKPLKAGKEISKAEAVRLRKAITNAIENSSEPVYQMKVRGKLDPQRFTENELLEAFEKIEDKICCKTGNCGSCAVHSGFQNDGIQGAARVFYQMANGEPLAAIMFNEVGKAAVRVFNQEQADVATVVHELAHLFRYDVEGDDLTVLEEYYEVENGQWYLEAEEQFADDLTQYLQEGRHPDPKVQTLFARFKQWLEHIYGWVQGTSEIPDSVRAVFDHMFSSGAAEVQASLEHDAELMQFETVEEFMTYAHGMFDDTEIPDDGELAVIWENAIGQEPDTAPSATTTPARDFDAGLDQALREIAKEYASAASFLQEAQALFPGEQLPADEVLELMWDQEHQAEQTLEAANAQWLEESGNEAWVNRFVELMHGQLGQRGTMGLSKLWWGAVNRRKGGGGAIRDRHMTRLLAEVRNNPTKFRILEADLSNDQEAMQQIQQQVDQDERAQAEEEARAREAEERREAAGPQRILTGEEEDQPLEAAAEMTAEEEAEAQRRQKVDEQVRRILEKSTVKPKEGTKTTVRRTTGQTKLERLVKQSEALDAAERKAAAAARKAASEARLEAVRAERSRRRQIQEDKKAIVAENVRIKRLVNDIKKALQQATKQGRAFDRVQQQEIINLLEGIDFVKYRRKSTIARLEATAQYLREEGDQVDMPDYVLEQLQRLDKTPIGEMTPDELADLHDAVMIRMKIATVKNEIKVRAKNRVFHEVHSEILRQMPMPKKPREYRKERKVYGMPKNERLTDRVRRKRSMKWFLGIAQDKPQLVVERVFGEGSTGMNVFWQQITDGETERERIVHDLYDAISQDLAENGVGLDRKRANWAQQQVTIKTGGGRKVAPAKVWEMERGQRISIYLHSLDEDNRESMLEGVGWPTSTDRNTAQTMTEQDLEAIINSMEPEEMIVAEAIRDHFRKMGPRLQEHFYYLNGWVPQMRENYFWKDVMPIYRQDSATAEQQQFIDSVKTKHIRIGVPKNRMIERKDVRLPIYIHNVFDVLNRTILEDGAYLALEEPLRNASKLLGTDEMKRAIIDRWGPRRGPEILHYLDKYLRDVGGATQEFTGLGNFVDNHRAGITSNALGINLGVATMQALSYPFAANYIPAQYLVTGGLKQAMKPKTSIETHMFYDPRFRERIEGGHTYDIADATQKDSTARRIFRAKNIKDVGFLPSKGVDAMTVSALANAVTDWLDHEFTRGRVPNHPEFTGWMANVGITKQEILDLDAEGRTEVAYGYLRHVVGSSQPMFSKEYQPELRREGWGGRLMTMFSSFTNQELSMFRRAMGDARKGSFRRLTYFGAAFAINTLGMFMIRTTRELVRGTYDDDDDLGRKLAQAAVSSFSGMYFGVRDVSNAALNGRDAELPISRVVNYLPGIARNAVRMNDPELSRKERAKAAAHVANDGLDLFLMLNGFWYAASFPRKRQQLIDEVFD